MPPSSSRSKISPEGVVLPGPFAPALSVDVEEWFHNCWVPEYNAPSRPAGLSRELDRLLPRLAEELGRNASRATFFVLGELARECAPRLRELVVAGHEIACHGYHHLRANDLAPREFVSQLNDARRLLEDLTGVEVRGYRAPEWSLRAPSNPRLRLVAEAGFAYDSSLVRALGAGSRGNPDRPTRYRWSDGLALTELPPLTWGGRLRLPAAGWCGRLASPRWLLAAARRALAAGGLPLLVVHPWELVDRPCPGMYTGLARLFHDAGRVGFGERFRTILAGSTWRSLADVLAENERLQRRIAAGTGPADTAIDGLALAPAGASR